MPARDTVRRLIYRATIALLSSSPILVMAQEPAGSGPAQSEVELTLPQAQEVARNALKLGQPTLARNIAFGLLQADANSGFAHYVIATAEGQLGRPEQAEKAAAKAYRFANTRVQHYEAAQLAARMYFKAQKPTRAQLWLRRAIHHAPDAQTEAQLERDYKAVRAQNPLSFSIRSGLRPSNNVNSGADSGLQIIDGLPYVGTLSGSAQALSGLIAHVDGNLSYRLRGDQRSRTEIDARIYVKRVSLDSDAKSLSPDIRDSDFSSTYSTLGLTHAVKWGPRDGVSRMGLRYGQYWSAGTQNYDFVRLEGGHSWRIGGSSRLSLTANYEARNSAAADSFDTELLSIGLGARRPLANGDAISLALNLRKTFGDLANSQSEGMAISAGYSLGEQVGPVILSGGVTIGHADYPDYTSLFVVPGGRQDLSLSAHVDMIFPDFDYAGFAPSLRVATSRTKSNVSRFETRELSVALSIQSKF